MFNEKVSTEFSWVQTNMSIINLEPRPCGKNLGICRSSDSDLSPQARPGRIDEVSPWMQVGSHHDGHNGFTGSESQ